jgi:hypothetical protein
VSGQLRVAPYLPHGKSVASPFDRRLGGPQRRLEFCGEESRPISCAAGKRTSIPRSTCLYSIPSEVFLIPCEGYMLWNDMTSYS